MSDFTIFKAFCCDLTMLNERERTLISELEIYKKKVKLITGEYQVFAQKTNVELRDLRKENAQLKNELKELTEIGCT